MREQRKDERNELKHPFTLEVLTDKLTTASSHACRVLDISAKGARIETSAVLESGMRVRLRVTFQTASGANAVAPLGSVKWVRKVADSHLSRAGIELSKITSRDIEKWAQYVAKKRTVIF